MRIYTKITYSLQNDEYVLDNAEYFEYNGLVELVCGASAAQNSIEASQQNFYNQLTSQASTVFGAASSVFNSLVNTFSPTVQAGPNQQGFSQQELSALNSQAITNVGQGYKNAKAATGNAEAAVGGGNVYLPSGAQIGENTELAEGAANQTASELNQITQQNYAVGRQNYAQAVAGLANAPGVFNAADNAAGTATGAGSAASSTANQIAQENNSWMSAVSGALGGALGAATGGLTNYALGLGNQGGSNANNAGASDYLGNLQGGQAQTTSYTMPANYTIGQ